MNKKKTILEKLTAFYSNLSMQEIPTIVVDKAKTSLMDYIFVYILGYKKGQLSRSIIKYVEKRNKNQESTLLIENKMFDAELTTLVSSLIAHSVELDDGHRWGTSHPAVVIFPSAIAVAEKQNSTVEELIKGIIIGYDLMLRVSRSINPSHLKRGFHSTSTTGTIGSAAAVSAILNYNQIDMAHAISIAGLLSSGLQEMLHGHPSIKAFQVGRSCQSGVLAAEFVKYGGKGPLTLFEGEHGWIKAMTDKFNKSILLDDLGNRWEILNTYTKQYPSCRHTHHAIDLAIDVFNSNVSFNTIKKVTIETYSIGYAEVGLIRRPKNLEEAMFSISYAVAIAFKYGFVTYENLEQCIEDNEVLKLSDEIVIKISAEMDKVYPEERGCNLIIETSLGNVIKLNTKLPKGEPETPLSKEDYKKKFKLINSETISNEKFEALYCLLDGFDYNREIRELIREINTFKI